MHFYDWGIGEYYGFSACGKKVDRSKLITDPKLVTCKSCVRTRPYKERVK